MLANHMRNCFRLHAWLSALHCQIDSLCSRCTASQHVPNVCQIPAGCSRAAMSAGPYASRWLMSCTGTPRKQGPPALRQILPAPSANGALSRKRSLEQENGNRSDTSSSSDDEDARSAPGKHHQANGAARKKRRNVLPVIRRDQRCGKCRTCLNPQVPCLLPQDMPLCNVPSARTCAAACSTQCVWLPHLLQPVHAMLLPES